MNIKSASLLFASLLLFAACGRDATGVDATCIAVVNVHGVFYGTPSFPELGQADVSSDVYLTVSRDTGCLDQGEPSSPLADGESNFLPAGTALHRVVGVEPEVRLAYWATEVREWRPLEPWGSASP